MLYSKLPYRILGILLLICTYYPIVAQDMQEGFKYLETGQYQAAYNFFDQLLIKYPENRTARLCYGRAVGLLGNSAEALLIFKRLQSEFPNDVEIQLNYAEALLWDHQFTLAQTYYEKLIMHHPKRFSAVLGYANTLSNLKKYPDALTWVNKALDIDANNKNAFISRKYIRLGYAFALTQHKKYDHALKLLDANLIDFPRDKETLLNKANLYLQTNEFKAAEQAFTNLAKTAKDSIVALNGLALIAHKQNQQTKALRFAMASKNKLESFPEDTKLRIATMERYIQALLWNRKFTQANHGIQQLKTEFHDIENILSLEATYCMYTGNFTSAIGSYSDIIDKNKRSFDGNLGIANAYRAIGDDLKAYTFAYRTLEYYPQQKDAEGFIQKLKQSHNPFVENKSVWTFDNGNNKAFSTHLSTQFPLSTRFKSTLNYMYRTTKNNMIQVDAQTNYGSIGLGYQLSRKIYVFSNLGMIHTNAITKTYTTHLIQSSLKANLFNNQYVTFAFRRKLQDFNATLIDRKIIMNMYQITNSMNITFDLGWYTQYVFTSQTDDNKSNQLFTSFYYKLFQKPLFKAGINYQYIAFKDQLPNIYFSPKTFHLGEVFTEVNGQKGAWKYRLIGAFGRQFVNTDEVSTTYRAEGLLRHQFSDRFSFELYGKYSSIASATAVGFEFTEVGYKLKWYFTKKPLFDKKISAYLKNNTN